ncbi:MAG: hypothetical protein ACKVRN_00380 [Pyrinomonadaceae bacterium]
MSDFAGLFIFPLFICSILAQCRKIVFPGVIAGFIVWKSPYVQPLIDTWNNLGVIRIGRTVDVTDLLALVSVLLAYLYLQQQTAYEKYRFNAFAKVGVIILSVFAFTATSFEEDRHVWAGNDYEIQMSRAVLEDRLRRLDTIREVNIEKMTDVWPKDQYPKLDMSPTGYYLRFKIRTAYCESKEIDFFCSFEDKGASVYIDNSQSFRYWCRDKPTENDTSNLSVIFEDKVISQLTHKLEE